MPKTFRIIALSLVGLAILLAIIALGIGKDTGKTQTQPAAGNEQAAAPSRPTMVVAARALSAGKPVVLGDLKTLDVDQVPAGHFTSAYQAAGALPARDIAADTPLTAELFLHGLSSHLQPGERAIAIAVDEITGVGNHVQPGDYVDVFVALPETGLRGETSRDPPMTRMIASRLRVLSYGENTVIADPGQTAATASSTVASTATTDATDTAGSERANAITARSNQNAAGSKARGSASSAVLAVPPDQAGTLLLGAQEGRLHLALRHPGDLAVVDRERFADNATVIPIGKATGWDDGQADITAEERAYAGVPLGALTGAGTAVRQIRTPPTALRTASPQRRPVTGSHSVQIVRGSQSPRPLASY